MATLFLNGKVSDDEWQFVDGESPVPAGENVIVSLQLFKENEQTLLSRNSGQLGVHLEAGDQVDEIAGHLESIALVSLEFPSFADGRAFSKARLLRDLYGFQGQVRATGDVRIDQVSQMHRCGCDALQITHKQTIDQMIADEDPGLKLFYQPALNDAPSHNGKRWARRAI